MGGELGDWRCLVFTLEDSEAQIGKVLGSWLPDRSLAGREGERQHLHLTSVTLHKYNRSLAVSPAALQPRSVQYSRRAWLWVQRPGLQTSVNVANLPQG